jgi:two-component system, cell cycle sensor histidine kinase and response regulator CckA
VRELVHQVLDKQGYTLLQAENGSAALQLADTYSPPIHLLLTDVIMPDMNGRVLAERLLQTRSDLKILFMSGYTHEVIARHQILEPGVAFIQKPFSAAALARQVRALLDE